MKYLVWSLALLVSAPLFAQEKPASAESVREVMAVTKSKEMLDMMYGQMDGAMAQAMRDISGGKPLTAEQEKVFAEVRSKMMIIIREEMSWDKMEPVFVDIYQKSLSQSEVDGMLVFYRSKAGKAVIEKMPAVMQNTMQAMAGVMQRLSPRMHALQVEMVEKVKAAGESAEKEAAK